MQTELLFEIRLKISAGTASPAELLLWEEWISQPHIQAQQFVSEAEIEQRLRIDMAKPDWESFLQQQEHNLIYVEEDRTVHPNNPDTLLKHILSSRPPRNLIVKLVAAIIIGIMLCTAAYLIINKRQQATNLLAVVEYKTIHSPAGKTISFTLPDGSKVWLNTNTTLRYPEAFTNCYRKVDLNGEAYFDVVKDEQRPFIVRTDSSETRVLGTRFNVDAYKGTGILKVSLLEGSVLVGKRDESVPTKLEPGEQSVFNNGSFSVIKMSRPEEATAWQRDSFAFDQARLADIMHKLAQYYNFNVKIDKEIENERFTVGVTERTIPVMRILRGLERTKAFRIYPQKSSISPGDTIMILKNE
ncbi:FecR family protein [Pseudoflavitalea rhizosphaerae]|uniref:FecR family protein n=1 Tax=Pseudoflavitalea rhizosphaerae TaxID=1884793 RepID=UPI000F8F3AB6|nr:FecR family protein [Pseudoflavitalea rhizosphaerae]